MFLPLVKLPVKCVLLSFVIACVVLSGGVISAQTKSRSSKTVDAKKTAKATAKTTAKDDKKAADLKDKKSKNSKDQANKGSKEKTAKSDPKNKSGKEPAKKNFEKVADKGKDKSKDKKDSKTENAKKASAREIEIERREKAEKLAEARRIEEARRQAALEERRRREQAAREARERFLAFERGLRTETIQNIASDDLSGEDMEARSAAIRALGTHAGTVVVMEAQTGKVLSIVNQDWAVRKGFKPCSTIKLVTGVAATNEKLIDENGDLKRQRFRMNLDDALAHSNNTYFQMAGSNLGSSRMIGYARELGLGAPTGINAKGETAGKLPFGNENSRIYSHGDDFEVTPLQLAVMVSAISNGGKVVVPQIPRNQSEKVNFRAALRREMNLPKESFQKVLPGMVGAVAYGTARRSGGREMSVAGKTGSCIGQGSWVGLFASVAPVVNPKLAVVVITRGHAERGKYASAIAGNVYRALAHRYGSIQPAVQLAKLPEELKPQQKVTAQASAKLDSAEDEDTDEAAAEVAVEEKPAPRISPKKGDDDVVILAPKVQKTASSKPTNVFSPVVITVNREVKQTKSRPRVVPE